MAQVLQAYPGAQRALFRKYHIGGCGSCGFHLEETLEQLCQRNALNDMDEVLAHLRDSYQQDELVLISPKEAVEWREREPALRLVDVRSREEFEAVHIEGSVLLSQPVMKEILADGSNTRPLILIDHQGKHALDAAAYFLGHGLRNVRCLRGGIDAWSREVDPQLKRYQLEMTAAT